MVLEFYGIDGECMTLGKASKIKLVTNLAAWAEILVQCCEALAYIHKQNFIHCDIKGDNLVLRKSCDEVRYVAVIIDFGKMKEMKKAKLYRLSVKEQDRYARYHNHIAPEVVDGKATQTAASDIYSLGQVISLVCHYNYADELKQIARQCIHGTPSKRPNIEDLISKLSLCTDANNCTLPK